MADRPAQERLQRGSCLLGRGRRIVRHGLGGVLCLGERTRLVHAQTASVQHGLRTRDLIGQTRVGALHLGGERVGIERLVIHRKTGDAPAEVWVAPEIDAAQVREGACLGHGSGEGMVGRTRGDLLAVHVERGRRALLHVRDVRPGSGRYPGIGDHPLLARAFHVETAAEGVVQRHHEEVVLIGPRTQHHLVVRGAVEVDPGRDRRIAREPAEHADRSSSASLLDQMV